MFGCRKSLNTVCVLMSVSVCNCVYATVSVCWCVGVSVGLSVCVTICVCDYLCVCVSLLGSVSVSLCFRQSESILCLGLYQSVRQQSVCRLL